MRFPLTSAERKQKRNPLHDPLFLGSLLSLDTSELLLGFGLDRPLRVADGTNTGDGGGAKVGSVSVFGRHVGGSLVGSIIRFRS